MRVLVVDDEPLMLRAVKRSLAARGFDVATLERNPWAEELQSVDAVLTDWAPYGMDTVLACQEVGRPVVVYTGGNTHEIALQVPRVQVLQKPAAIDDIVEALGAAK